MGSPYGENDGRFPDDSPVLVRYPLGHEKPKPADDGPAGAGLIGSLRERREWPWLPGRVLGQCGPDEWHIAIEVRELATLEDDSPAPDGTPDEDLFFPACYRDSSEIRQAREEASPAADGDAAGYAASHRVLCAHAEQDGHASHWLRSGEKCAAAGEAGQ